MMRVPVAVAAATFAVGLVACGGGMSLEEAAGTIAESDYMAKLAVIADDSMMGRDTPSDGLEKTAAWIAEEFANYGLEPAGEDGFFQRWPYPAFRPDWDATTIDVQGAPAPVLGESLVFSGQASEGTFSGEVVLVTGSEMGQEQIAALDVSGKHVLIFPGSPRVSRLGRLFGDAAGVFVVSALEGEEWDSYVTLRREAMNRVYGGDPDFSRPPQFAIHSEAAMELVAASGMSAPATEGPIRQLDVPGVTITVTTAAEQVDDAMPPNVVAILRGSDPELADEYVVFSAHMDHVGVNGRGAREDSVFDASGAFMEIEMDSIFNGADDDASGTIGVVEVAEAFSKLAEPPRRSMVFLLVSGEEKGLLGSRWYADNPTVPAESIVANFNTDMIGRNWSDTIVVIGKEHSELGSIMNEVGARHPELNMAPIDDRWPEQNFYGRSDHFNFARRGVPVLFFFSGVHPDYHRPTDEVRKVDGEKAARISQLVFYLSNEVANLDEAPKWYDDSYDQFVSAAPEGAPRRSRTR